MTKKKPEIIFAPGCFDGFDGTQEELQDMIAQIHQMLQDGTLMENSTPLSDEESQELQEIIEKRNRRQ